MHAITPLSPFGSGGKYIGKNPFTKKKDDLIIDSSHGYIVIKSDSFAGTWSDFRKQYRMKLFEKKFASKKNTRSINNEPDLKLQKKLFTLDSEIESLCKEIKKIHKQFDPILSGSKRAKYYLDTEFDIVFQFSVSKKHTAYNQNDDNFVYEDNICEGEELDRRENYYPEFKTFHSKYQKEKWSSLIKYLYSNCTDEDILCIDNIFVDIKPIVQLSTQK